jgi:hypothetical protein
MSKLSALSKIVAELEAEIAAHNRDIATKRDMIARLKSQPPQKPRKPRMVPRANEAS